MAKKRGNNEGSITKRKDGRWMARITLPDGQRVALYGKTREEAARKLAQALRSSHEGLELPKAGRVTVGQFLQQWSQDHVRNLEPKTAYGYEQQVRLHINPALGRVSLAKLTPQMVQRWVNELRDSGLSPKSVKIAHGVLRAALNVAVDWRLLSHNPASRVSLPKVERKEPPYLTLPQAQALLVALQDDRLEALYLTTVMLALRRGEVLGLKWEDIDFEAGTVHVRRAHVALSGKVVVTDGKTPESWAKLPLPELAADALRRRRVQQAEERLKAGSAWQEAGYVFTTGIGTPIAPRNLVRHWHGLLVKAGLPSPMPFHTLRHSAASIMLALGVPLRVVQQVMRHRQVSLTADLYGHIPLDVTRDALRQFNEALSAK